MPDGSTLALMEKRKASIMKNKALLFRGVGNGQSN
jgi:hypothetical protein